MTFVADIQNEIPSLLSRWRMSDAVGAAYAADDVGGIDLAVIGAPILSLPSFTKGDAIYSSALGSVGNYFSAVGITAYSAINGIALEGVSVPDPNGNAFNLISLPGQAQLQLSGLSVVFNVWIGATLHALTASSVLGGWPQHIVGTYDAVAGTQAIFVDGQSVASQALSGSVGTQIALNTTATTSTSSDVITAVPIPTAEMQIGGVVTGAAITADTVITVIPSSSSLQLSENPTISGTSEAITIGVPITIAKPISASVTQAAAQNVAIYGAPLSKTRIAQLFQAFRQILADPGHVRVFPQIGVLS